MSTAEDLGAVGQRSPVPCSESVVVDMHDAVLEPETQALCRAGYREALQRFGLHDLRASTPDRAAPGQRWVVLVRPQPAAAPIGGLWLDRLGPRHRFSKVDALRRQDPRLPGVLPTHLDGGLGELATGWIDGDWGGRGLFALLALAAVCGAPRMGVERIVTLASGYTFGSIRKVGFQVVESIGDQGWFDYPVGYRSVLCQCPTTAAAGVRPAWHDAYRAGLAGARELVVPNARPGGPAARIRLPPVMPTAAKEIDQPCLG